MPTYKSSNYLESQCSAREHNLVIMHWFYDYFKAIKTKWLTSPWNYDNVVGNYLPRHHQVQSEIIIGRPICTLKTCIALRVLVTIMLNHNCLFDCVPGDCPSKAEWNWFYFSSRCVPITMKPLGCNRRCPAFLWRLNLNSKWA